MQSKWLHFYLPKQQLGKVFPHSLLVLPVVIKL
jgi:hypothetical protein